MPLLITYDEWIKETFSLAKLKRSDSLKKIDNAIKMRNEKEALKSLIEWIDSQNKAGQDWHRSVRNQKSKIVEKLAQQLGYRQGGVAPMKPIATMQDTKAKVELRNQIREASAKMFEGKRVVFSNVFLQAINDRRIKGNQKLKSKSKGGAVVAVGANAATIALNANTARSVVMQLMSGIEAAMEGIPEAQRIELIEMALGAGVADFAAECAPYVGTLISGGSTVWNLLQMIYHEFGSGMANERRGDVRTGDAGQALTAMIQIIDDEITRNGKEAAIHGTAFAAKAAMVCAAVPGDSIVGAVEGVMMLIHNIYELVKKYKEMNAANERLALGNIDATIFNTCPILGCYYVAVQGDFTIMNFDVGDMGTPNWMQEVRRLKYSLEPVKKKAASLIRGSSIIIEGMEQMQGIYQRSLWHRISQPLKNRFTDRTAAPHTSDTGHSQHEYKLENIDKSKFSQKELDFLRFLEPN